VEEEDWKAFKPRIERLKRMRGHLSLDVMIAQRTGREREENHNEGE
jgi:hypothetical protein